MSRIKLEIPSSLIASLSIPVRITDINYGNHVGNDSIVSILHEARMQWLHGHGHSEKDIHGTGLIMSDLAVEFKNESFYGDNIEVGIYAGEISRVSFELYYQLRTIRATKNIIIANAKTGMVCYDYTTKKTVSIPAELLQLLSPESTI